MEQERSFEEVRLPIVLGWRGLRGGECEYVLTRFSLFCKSLIRNPRVDRIRKKKGTHRPSLSPPLTIAHSSVLGPRNLDGISSVGRALHGD
jgi:hypothetical protein